MTSRGILSGWFYVPDAAIGDVRAMRTRLTFVPKKFGEEPPVPLRLYDASVPGYLGVPREFGLNQFRGLEYDDRTTLGTPIRVPLRPDPRHPRVRNPEAQAAFMANLADGMRRWKSMTASAPTGSGKTVCALNTAAELGRRTIIFVHLERLMHQWVDEIESKLGVPRDRIGIVQQDRCEWEGKDFVVALLHSVVRRSYPAEFYRAFGFAIYDEMHKVGTQFFAPAVHLFPCRYKLGLSATVHRKDGGERVYFWHLGPIRVTSEAEALPLKCYVLPYRSTKPLWGSNHGSRIKCLTQDPDRNALIVSVIKRFYNTGRNALVVSESVEHLQKLMAMAERVGVPRSAMGQFTSEVHRTTTVAGKRKTTKSKQSKDTLDFVKEKAQLIFATYGMMTEGIDIPRLDAGIDATPRSAATQLIGRIRRPMPGKRLPLWITVRDLRCSTSERYFKARCADYQTTNVEVVYNGTQAQSFDARGTGRAEEAVVGRGTQCPPPRTLPTGQAVPREDDPAGARRLPPDAGRGWFGGPVGRLHREPAQAPADRTGPGGADQ
jgi:superfamily II DNA or RNA helicase